MSRKATELAAELLHASLRILSENGGRLPSKEVIEGAGKIAKPHGDECAIYESTGNVRWKAILHLQSIGLVKAGYIQKRKGIWYLTEDGEKALGYSPQELWREMNRRYRAWKAAESPDEPPAPSIQPLEAVAEDPGQTRWLETENVEALATDGVVQAIRRLDPDEFRDRGAVRIADDLREMMTEPGEMPVDGTQWDMPTAEQRRVARLPEKLARRLRPVWRSMLDEVDPAGSGTPP